MGWRAAGICHDTMEQAAATWTSQYPKQVGTEMFSAEAVNITEGQITYNLTSSSGTSYIGDVAVTYCDPGQMSFSQMPINSLILVVALVMVWGLGLSAGLKR